MHRMPMEAASLLGTEEITRGRCLTCRATHTKSLKLLVKFKFSVEYPGCESPFVDLRRRLDDAFVQLRYLLGQY